MLSEVQAQGFDRWGTSNMSHFLRSLVRHHPSVSARVVRHLADETLQRPDISLPMARRVVDAVRFVHYTEPGGRKVSHRVWAHVARIWDAIEAEGNTSPQPTTLVRLLHSLALVADQGAVGTALFGRLTDRLLGLGLASLTSDERTMLHDAVARLTSKDGQRHHRDKAAALYQGLWDVWAQQPLDALFEEASRRELSGMLVGLWLDGGRPQTDAVMQRVVMELERRKALHVLSPGARQGLLVWLVQAHARLQHKSDSTGEEAAVMRGVLLELMGDVVKLAAEDKRMVPKRGRRAWSRAAYFSDTLRSKGFVQDLASLYLAAEDGAAGLSLHQLGDLLEFLGRCQHTVGNLSFELQEGVRRGLRDSNPAELDRDRLFRLLRSLTFLKELLPSEAYGCQLSALCAERGLEGVTYEQLHSLIEFVNKTQPEASDELVHSITQACLNFPYAEDAVGRKKRMFSILNELQRVTGAPITEPPSIRQAHAQ